MFSIETSARVEHWGEVAPRYVHHWTDFEEAGLVDQFWKCLWRLYPDRVVINRIIPLDIHEGFRSYIKPSNFPAIRDGLDHVLLDISIEGISVSKDERRSFMRVVSSDPEYQRVWFFWFWMEQNKFNHVRRLNTSIKKMLKRMQ